MRAVVTGGAGFIGSNLVDRLIADGHSVTVVDNLTGHGGTEFLAHHEGNDRFRFVEADVRETDRMKEILDHDVDLVFHLAANADIARGVEDPTLDFEHSLVATFSVLQAMRECGVGSIAYTSGSGVYGDQGGTYLDETYGPLEPVSMYGASKLGAEGLISAFCNLFGMRAWILRPANIIGPRLTHGVVYDFVHRLREDPTRLRVLGDGEQSKAYLHVADVIEALLLILEDTSRTVSFFNVSSDSFITVNEIAEIVASGMGLDGVELDHTGGKVGWKGDVPVIRLASDRLETLGWKPRYTSAQAVAATVSALL